MRSSGVLVAADLSVPNGTPHVKDELIREGKVTKPFIQGLRQLVWVPFVLPQLNHGGSCVGEGTVEAQMVRHLEAPSPRPSQAWTPPARQLTQLRVSDSHVTLQQVIHLLYGLLLKG